MLELHQFRHSAFCLKVRMVLQAKGLSYRAVDVSPGIGQLAVFRLSGQRQVPVLVDGDTVLPIPVPSGGTWSSVSPSRLFFPLNRSWPLRCI